MVQGAANYFFQGRHLNFFRTPKYTPPPHATRFFQIFKKHSNKKLGFFFWTKNSTLPPANVFGNFFRSFAPKNSKKKVKIFFALPTKYIKKKKISGALREEEHLNSTGDCEKNSKKIVEFFLLPQIHHPSPPPTNIAKRVPK